MSRYSDSAWIIKSRHRIHSLYSINWLGSQMKRKTHGTLGQRGHEAENKEKALKNWDKDVVR
jgi:hypothetical protein